MFEFEFFDLKNLKKNLFLIEIKKKVNNRSKIRLKNCLGLLSSVIWPRNILISCFYFSARLKNENKFKKL